jgi:hypothetical protein
VNALAVGFVVASAVRVGFEAPGLRAIRFTPRPAFDLKDPGPRLVLAMAPLVLVGNSVGNSRWRCSRRLYPALGRSGAADDRDRFRELTGRGLATLGLVGDAANLDVRADDLPGGALAAVPHGRFRARNRSRG